MPIAAVRRLALAATLSTAAAATAVAQDSTARIAPATAAACDYASCVLRIEETWLSQTLVTGDGRVVARLGWGGPRLDRIVAVSDSAVAHARAYRRAQNTGSLLTLVATLAWIGSAAAYADDRGTDAIPISLGAVAVGLAGRSFELRARRELAQRVVVQPRGDRRPLSPSRAAPPGKPPPGPLVRSRADRVPVGRITWRIPP